MNNIAIDARIISSSTGQYVVQLLNYLQKIDTVNIYSILVLAKDKDFYQPTASNFIIKVADFDNYSFAEQIGFKKFLDELAPDLVHFCMPQQPVLYRGNHVTTFHDLTLLKTYNSDKNWLTFHIKQLFGRYVFKKVAKTSSQIIVPSKFTKNELLNFVDIPSDKITVTYEAADVFIKQLIPYKHPFKEFLLYVGKQSDYKNIRRLGDAHQKLLEKYPDLGLILVGQFDAATQRNQTYFNNNNYHNILFTGFLPDQQRDWLYTKATAYVFPSLMEGFGLPGLEAMGYGTPVISSNTTCLPEIYGEAAHYFNPLDTIDIARAIDEVLSNQELRNKLIELGNSKVKEYSWQRLAEQTYEVYQKALNNK
jgi:glycosyltransferase involved in cell wall biosynthesis